MTRIAIIDESRNDALSLKEQLKRFASSFGDSADIVWFSDVVTFFEAYSSDYDVIFLEAHFSYADGFAVAGRIRQLDRCVSIIFTSSMKERAIDGYKVGAADFLIKPVTYAALSAAMERIMPLVSAAGRNRFSIKTPAGLRCINPSSIMFVEVRRHRLTFHTADEQFEAWGTLAAIEQELPQNLFFRISSCFIVNMQYIARAEGEYITVGKTELKISRRRKYEFICHYEYFLKGRAG